jgi:hypothetical protein
MKLVKLQVAVAGSRLPELAYVNPDEVAAILPLQDSFNHATIVLRNGKTLETLDYTADVALAMTAAVETS